MLDTSDKQIFQSGYDAAMGTKVTKIIVTDEITPIATFNEKRRTLLIYNSGLNSRVAESAPVYICFTQNVSPELYTTLIRSNNLFAIDNYGGMVTAVCEEGEATTLCVTEMQ